MKFIYILFLTVNVVFCIQYGTNVLDIKQYPFYVMIGNPHICGGTLLSYDPPLVLTAAHCVDAPTLPSSYAKDKNPYFVNYYDVQRDKQKSVGIAEWTIHPLYNVSSVVNMNYDVAIVRLDTPLKKSTKVKRIPLWSPQMNTTLPKRGELIGFGFTALNGKEAKQLQRLQLDITVFNPNGLYNVEARSDTEEHIACHGDSGSPLVVYHTVKDPLTKKEMTVPYVVGNLARIFGARDQSPTRLTCPIPNETAKHKFDSSLNTVTESFCNIATMMDWISLTTGISKEDLSDPFYNPPHPPCVNCKNSTSSNKAGNGFYIDYSNDDDDDDEEESTEDDESDESKDKSNERQWHIGVAPDQNGLLGTHAKERFWIGGIGQDFSLRASPEASLAIHSKQSMTYVLFTFITFLYNYTLFTF